MSRHVSALIKASHPEPAVAVTAVTALLAWGVGHRPIGILLVAATVAATQLAVGWTNDWLDAGRDRQAGRTDKPIPAGAVSRRLVGAAGLAAAAPPRCWRRRPGQRRRCASPERCSVPWRTTGR